ncbi:hypothetical protein EIB18_07730 [Caulobacter vibrioides]|nr:hypothetical protein CA608_07995 [Caulobacter vibrioides]AZH12614.1 hypothetical protein EIB18_07730 [Caulobacter vibrioides]PLR15048.1 hypothetical protein CVUC_03590 [Caulobacter vibrioides]
MRLSPRLGRSRLDDRPPVVNLNGNKLRGDASVLDKALLIQLGGSVVAVALLVAFAGWLGVARATPPLDPAAAKALLDIEFPDHQPQATWIAADGAGVIARDGDLALVLYKRGDGYVARDLPWSAVAALKPAAGRLTVRVSDARPTFAVNDDVWPPKELA